MYNVHTNGIDVEYIPCVGVMVLRTLLNILYLKDISSQNFLETKQQRIQMT